MRFTNLKTPFSAAIFLLLFTAVACFGQTKSKPKTEPTNAPNVNATQAVKSTPAYAEVLLRKTELEATLDDLTIEFTDEYPKVKEARHELGLIRKEFDKISAVADTSKLTLALGKLILRKVQLETDVWALLQKYGEEHTDVKRARRKVSAYEKAIKEILP
jgi:hypothetical protein